MKFERMYAELMLDSSLHFTIERVKTHLLPVRNSSNYRSHLAEWRRFHKLLIKVLKRKVKMYERKIGLQGCNSSKG